MNEISDVHRNGIHGFVSLKTESKQIGMMTLEFSDKNNKLLIDRTEVIDEFKGRGYGKMLVAKVIEFARENRYILVPYCPFASKVLNETPEYSGTFELPQG
ncbi:MAG TPA: GNAT family N-acetyltransferase [Paludibacter sp.]|nr:GNAT family N-acetyltransferase [Paludibacter sp.]